MAADCSRGSSQPGERNVRIIGALEKGRVPGNRVLVAAARQLAIPRLTRQQERRDRRRWYGSVPVVRMGQPGPIDATWTRPCSVEIGSGSELAVRNCEW